ncbi:polysaccharide deacetylase family protein [Methanoculleus sp. FWC-SCC1]|uniref:Polysaccharide deacetylase family protein n=1 Tax=Methanoculleus frigidifontis TaxID=2584085 RepID=A0ABT8MCJ0_9EURY|nr:polysaccharide deacetylase family protein [Methanoculleus sp. FWC-SCC1]MDN7025652.1 polysaccharide deacetylase family protein [Methanoculleus sp. FWC-SCC1]
MVGNYFEKLIYGCIRYSGIPFIFREIIQRNKVTILYFHDINPDTAEKIFGKLMSIYNIISLNDFLYLHREKKNPPKKALIITFDDGHRGNYKLLPIIKKFHIPVTIYLCSGIINTNRHFWFKEKHPFYNGRMLKNTQNSERLRILKEIGFEQEKTYLSPQALSKNQIIEMLPFVNFQSHTIFHPCLTKCDDSEAWNEIFISKQMLERDYNLDINAIAYPNGNYSDRDIQLCMDAGYEFGLTTEFGFNTYNTDPFRLKRLSVNDTDDINELIVRVSGFWAFLKFKILRLKS